MNQKVILHLSDPHFGAGLPAAAAAFLDQAPGVKPDLTVLSGDLTMRARREELADARRFVDALPQPRVVIPGNHDVPALNQPLDRFLRPFHRYRRSFGTDLEPEYRAPGLELVSLNSTRAYGLHADWSEGRLSARQLKRLPGRFRGEAGQDLRVLVLHHPLVASAGHRREIVQPGAALMEALALARIDLVLCGHFHQSIIVPLACGGGAWTAVISQASTVCSTRLQGEPQGFHEIRCGESSLEIIAWVFDGTVFEPGPPVAFARGPQGWVVAPGG